MKDGGRHEGVCPFSMTRTRAKMQIGISDRARRMNVPGHILFKITQKILEMHGKFGYNVTIMYSKMYSEL